MKGSVTPKAMKTSNVATMAPTITGAKVTSSPPDAVRPPIGDRSPCEWGGVNEAGANEDWVNEAGDNEDCANRALALRPASTSAQAAVTNAHVFRRAVITTASRAVWSPVTRHAKAVTALTN